MKHESHSHALLAFITAFNKKCDYIPVAQGLAIEMVAVVTACPFSGRGSSNAEVRLQLKVSSR